MLENVDRLSGLAVGRNQIRNRLQSWTTPEKTIKFKITLNCFCNHLLFTCCWWVEQIRGSGHRLQLEQWNHGIESFLSPSWILFCLKLELVVSMLWL